MSCSNTPGGFTCGACPAGYTDDGSGVCVDDDECTLGTDDCDPLVTCTNMPGSFTCGACPDGYVDTNGDGTECTDIDECLDGTDDCDELVSCTNTPGGFMCGDCPDGYTDDGNGMCVDDDECELGTDNCDENATCSNIDGTFECECNTGYEGDGTTCEPTDDTLITGPADGDILNEDPPEITGTGAPGRTITITINGGDPIEVTVGDDGTWSYQSEEPLGDGEYTVETENDAVTFTIDTVAPDVAIVTPTEDEPTGEKPDITGTAEAGATITIFIDGEEVGQTTANEDGEWSFTPANALADGDHDVTVRATDAAGNSNEVNTTFTVSTASRALLSGGCGCATPEGDATPLALLLVLGISVALRRRRRS